MNILFLFGENQQKAVCYLGWYLAHIKPKCVYKRLCPVPIYGLAFQKELDEEDACISNLFFTKFT